MCGEEMPLELTHLRDSVQALDDLLAAAQNETRMAMLTDVERAGIQAGVVKNFEITYELCWKLIARWLNTNVTPGIADGLTRRALFRLAAESRLISDVEQWMQHHLARNLTVHVYDRKRAISVYRAAGAFLIDARSLLEVLGEMS